MTYESTPPPPPGGDPGGQSGPPGGSEHPEGTKLLVLSIIGLLCCAPINIYVLIKANGILSAPGAFQTSKVSTARIIAIVSLILWAVGIVFGAATGTFGGLLGG